MSRIPEGIKFSLALSIIISILCFNVNAVGYNDASLYQNIMAIDGLTYWQYEDGTNGGASEETHYKEYYRQPVSGSDTNATWYFTRGETPTKKIKYFYIPICSTVASSIKFDFVIGSSDLTTTRLIEVVSVETIFNGISTPCDYIYANNTGDSNDNYQSYLTLNTTNGTKSLYYLKDLEIIPKTTKADFIRIEINQDTTNEQFYKKYTFIGLYNIEPITPNDSETIISEISSIKSSVETIRTLTYTTNNHLNRLINTVIKYGDSNNYYLEAITYSTEEQTLIVNSLKQHFSTALQALQAQNNIINQNIIGNAPTENQVQDAIDKNNIAPDVDVGVLGAGRNDSGIGIILSQTKIIAMITLVIGLAILSYLLFGKKS